MEEMFERRPRRWSRRKDGDDQGKEGGATRCSRLIVFEDKGVIMVVKELKIVDRSDANGCAFRWFCDWCDVIM